MPGRGHRLAFRRQQLRARKLAVGRKQLLKRLILAAQAGDIHAFVDEVFKIAPCAFGEDVGLGAYGLLDEGIEQHQRTAGVEQLRCADDDEQHSGHARKACAHSALPGQEAKTPGQNQPRHKAGRCQQQG